MADQGRMGSMLDRENIRTVPGVSRSRILTDEKLEHRERVSLVSIYLAGKPGSSRFFITQNEHGCGILRNELPNQKRPRLYR
jgi:hypothetical protein